MAIPSTTADREHPDVAIVLRAYAAFEQGDIEAAVIDLHPDVVWIEPDEFPNGGERRGPDAVAEYLSLSRAGWASVTSEPTPYWNGEDIVIVHHVFGTLADGTPNDVTVADVFSLVDGKVVWMQAYAHAEHAFS